MPRHPARVSRLADRGFGIKTWTPALHRSMTNLAPTRIGIIGAGNIGGNLARKLVELGHRVTIANSRGPETLAGLVAELGPNATAGTATEAAEAGEFVIVTVPLRAYRDIPVAPLAGKIVIDTNNYYWERDGRIAELDSGEATVSGLLQAHLPESKVAKGFNNIAAADILTDGKPAGAPGRRALSTASDFDDAAALVSALFDDLGFDSVEIGPLAESWRAERDQPAYVTPQNREELVANLARAERSLAA
ncbi:NADP oxidoreductase [Agromyces sp. CFH 90414]|uniref:NADP oxidoreductase n=1 Tax=Agromyces agglutinans TaxID=2662258 RepID=A0A6I2F6K3_9MICO|nr:NAD(P)-binding domain-containing protein [Agromyces agglutinans]MRG60362.1 NADP oxidoreductase [Agromyces agglutinans]